jgi:hypothetical protein
MEDKSPVAGSREPIFNPLPLVAVVVEPPPGLALVVLVLPVGLVGGAVSQAAARKPTARVVKARAKAAFIFCIIFSFTPHLFRSLKVRFKLNDELNSLMAPDDK